MNDYLNDVVYVGVVDLAIDLFEGQYAVPEGIRYNSYLILDEKIAVMDTVDGRFTQDWLENVENGLEGRDPDYLVVQHVEPDHSGSIAAFAERYPSAKIVASAKAIQMIKNFYGEDFSPRAIVVTDSGTLPLGKRTLNFVTAPMVHWPEVVMTYESYGKLLFSADAFGKFGAIASVDDWACEARRYYFGIVGKYGVQVQSLLKKLADKPINAILPLHGPLLHENLDYYLGLYNVWSSYGVEDDGVTIAYTSVYGNTREAALSLAAQLTEKGVKTAIHDLARCDWSEAVEDAFRYGKLVLATTTYNNAIFPPMHAFLTALSERNYQNRKIALIENGSWAPVAAKTMLSMLEKCKNIEFVDEPIKILSALDETNREQIAALAAKLAE